MVSLKTSNVVWAVSAGRCMFPKCNSDQIGDLISDNEDKKFGFIAHIVARDPKGPRGDEVRSPLLADDPSNLMLLCHKHHKLIDDRNTRSNFPEELLLQYRAQAVDRVKTLMDIDPEKSTLVLMYGAKIGSRDSPLDFKECASAVYPRRYSQDRRGVQISIKGTIEDDGDEQFWKYETAALKGAFEREVHPLIKDGTTKHISVFGLAPMPLLVELGRQLGDLNSVDVFQRHREPQPSWNWCDVQSGLELEIIEPVSFGGQIALKLEISANFDDERIVEALDDNVSIWTLKASNANLETIKCRDDLSLFREKIRLIYNKIKERHGPSMEINVFPAVPVSAAIEIGRCWMPKVDLPLNIFDHRSDAGSLLRIRID